MVRCNNSETSVLLDTVQVLSKRNRCEASQNLETTNSVELNVEICSMVSEVDASCQQRRRACRRRTFSWTIRRQRLASVPSDGDGVPSSRYRRRKTGGGQALGALVARLAVPAAAVAAAVVTARALPRSQEVVPRREHRVVQIVLQVVRRRRQVSRDLGCAPHRPWRRHHRRRRAAGRLRERLRGGQGRRAVVPIMPATEPLVGEAEGNGR